MADEAGEKSVEATPHRRQQAREQGQIAQSQDLSSAALLIVGLGALLLMGDGLARHLAVVFQRQLGADAWLSADSQFLVAFFRGACWQLAPVLLPILGATLLAAIVLSLAQTGFLFLPERLVPDLSHIDPLKGLSRIFSLTGVMRLAFGFLKVIVVVAVAYFSLAADWQTILALPAMAARQIGSFMTGLLIWTCMKIAAALLLLALLDYGFQWWKQQQDLRMTPQEVREEMRNLQGDPQIISRRRSVQRQLVLSRLTSAVAKGDLTIVNPTELAVTLQYDPQTMVAPIVVAKGAGIIAQRIRRLSLEHGIPIVEKKPLAQALYRDVEVNRPVPHKLYAAVAEVLAYVYQLKGKSLTDANLQGSRQNI